MVDVLCVETVSVELQSLRRSVLADFLDAGGYPDTRFGNAPAPGKHSTVFHQPSDETFPAMIELTVADPTWAGLAAFLERVYGDPGTKR